MTLVLRLCISCLFVWFCSYVSSTDEALEYPYLSPASRQKREVDEACNHYLYGNKTNVKVPAHTGDNKTHVDIENVTKTTMGSGDTKRPITLPIIEEFTTTQTLGNYWNEKDVLIHVAYVNNPMETVSVYEPLHDGTCLNDTQRNATVLQSAISRQCLLAVNAGLFNTKTGECYGNIVSNGHLVQDSEGIQNAHFGITRDGQLFFGYLTEIDIVAEDFVQLVGGVIWVLKDGEDYVDKSIGTECRDTQETGTLQRFASVVSARTLVGHDSQGRVMIVQINGKTDKNGASLYEAATIMKKLGAINAVNLDGGGSSTLVINNTLANFPSDFCKDDKRFQCLRNVTTILCVHEPLCDPRDCGGHGSCDLGVCRCHDNWKGDHCERLECPGHCTDHGLCTEDGCICIPGYYGDDCATSCLSGWYGYQCKQHCHCENNATCSPADGGCICTAGYTGQMCQYRCRYGYYGDGCISQCVCDDSCACDHVTGSCNITYTDQDYITAGSCIANKLQGQAKLEVDMTMEYKSAISSIIVLAIICVISLTINMVVLWKYFTKWRHRNSNTSRYKHAQIPKNGRTYLFNNTSSFTTSTSSDEFETTFADRNNQSAAPLLRNNNKSGTSLQKNYNQSQRLLQNKKNNNRLL